MNKPFIYRAILLIAVVAMSIASYGQSSADFWGALEKCAELSQYQAHYPQLVPGQTQSHSVMDNGIEIPSLAGVVFSGTNTFTLDDKGSIMGNGLTEFFIVQDARFTPNEAHFELIYYYNFSGNYEHFVRGNITLTNLNGTWSVSASDFL